MQINKPKNTLLFVHIATHFKEIIRVARLLKSHKEYEPIVFFDVEYQGIHNDILLCKSEGIQTILYFEKEERAEQKARLWFKVLKFSVKKLIIYSNFIKYLFLPIFILIKLCTLPFARTSQQKEQFLLNKWSKLKARPHATLTTAFLVSCYRFVWLRKPQLLPTISRAANEYCKSVPLLLQEHAIKLMVFPEHNLFYFTQLFVYWGRKYNIPAVIVPFTIANTLEWSEAFYDDEGRSLKKIHNKIFANAFPRWVHIYKNRPLLLPVEVILLHEMFNITPENPWLLNSGDIDFLALESEGMKEYYLSAGIASKHLRATGALYNDELYCRLQQAEKYRRELYRTLSFSADKPMILCALPPDQCNSRKGLIEFKDFEETVRFIIAELSQYSEHYNIVINLHPRTSPETVKFINSYPVKIFSGDIAKAIPLSSIYVAVSSATIRMAISCAVPVINYDLYRYHYDDYQNLDGVLTLFDKNEFKLSLQKLAQENNFYAKIKEAQIEKSDLWGTLDGQAGKNLLSEIDLLFTN